MYHLLAQVDVSPNLKALPGGDQLKQVVDGLAAFAMIGTAAGLIIAALVWAFGAHSQNPHHAHVGKKGVLFAAGAAGIIGAAAGLVNFMVNLGHGVH